MNSVDAGSRQPGASKAINASSRSCQDAECTLGNVERWLQSLEYALHQGDSPQHHRVDELNDIFDALWKSRDTDHSAFRERVGRYFWSSALIRRCYEKPRGYPGDFVMMDWICNGSPSSETALGRWMDSWFKDAFPGTRSVRNRRDWMASLLSAEHRSGAQRVLNVASGGAPEFAALPRRVSFNEVVLLDQDEEALQFARRSFIGRPTNERLTTVCAKIKQLLYPNQILASNSFDVIYSMGLYDYLMQDAALALTRGLFAALAPGGLLVIGNYQSNHWGRYVVEAIMDWHLVYRDEKKLYALGNGLPGASCEVKADETGLVLLLHVRKAASASG